MNDKPHRPDGDGLRTTILQIIERDCQSIGIERVWAARYKLAAKISNALIATPQTRDGAEGAGSIAMSCCATDEQIAAHLADQRAASPKPAPDAMREVLAQYHEQKCAKHVNGLCSLRKCLIRGGWKREEFENVDYSLATCEELETAVILRSAPVPSPDGAREMLQAAWDEIKTAKEKAEQDCGTGMTLALAMIDRRLQRGSPSPAIATEPKDKS